MVTLRVGSCVNGVRSGWVGHSPRSGVVTTSLPVLVGQGVGWVALITRGLPVAPASLSHCEPCPSLRFTCRDLPRFVRPWVVGILASPLPCDYGGRYDQTR